MSDKEESEYYECPYCGDNDFDLIGLKWHLLNNCDEFQKTEDL